MFWLQVEDLLLEADVGSDFRMDHVLMKACQSIVQTACKDIPAGDARSVYSYAYQNLSYFCKAKLF